MPEPISDMNRNSEVSFLGDFYHHPEEPLDINVRNLENLSLMDNFSAVSALTTMENNENLTYFQDNFDASTTCGAPSFLDDPKEGNISRTVRVPSSEHVAEIVGRQGCKIKDLRARTNTYIKTPMRTQSPVFVVTGKEEAVLHVMEEINNAAEHFTHIRASRNHHKAAGLEAAKPMSREGDIVMYVTVPYRVVGLVVGLKGQTIKAIQQDTDTFIVTPNRDKEPTFEIRGQPENVKRAEMMIQRHIETRTRHCRLQDTTNLPTNWNDEQRYSNGSDYSFYNTDMSGPDNGRSSGSISSTISNYNGSCNSIINGQQQQQQHGPGAYNGQSSVGSYRSWRGYNSLMDQHPQQTPSISTWSNAGSEYLSGLTNAGSSVMLNGASPPSCGSRGNSSSLYYSMSACNTSPQSSNSASVSPPNEYLNETALINGQLPSPFGASSMSNGNPFLRRISEPSSEASPFSNLSFFTTAPDTSTKGSLVLGNLFQQQQSASNNNASSSLGINGLMSTGSSSMLNGSLGLSALHNEDITPLPSAAGSHPSPLGSLRRPAPGDLNIYAAGQMNGDLTNRFPSVESSASSEASGSQGSPAPKLCKVCEEAEVVAALVPCGHNLFCMECAEGIINKTIKEERVCPACKVGATDALHIRA